MCVNLDPDSHRCRIWGQEHYPDVCRRFVAEPATCGASRHDALQLLTLLEADTVSAVDGDA